MRTIKKGILKNSERKAERRGILHLKNSVSCGRHFLLPQETAD
jgi:hypothetical protein